MKQFVRYAAAAALADAGMAHAADLTVEVTGLKSANGQVLVAVYHLADDFLKQPMRTAAVDARGGTVQAVIGDLPPGEYALSVFQDENGNGKLNANLIGMPLEPYCFSNDAMGSFGPPGFNEARIKLSDAGGTTTLKLR